MGSEMMTDAMVAPATVGHAPFTKRREYQRRGVPEHWIVELDHRCIERWRPAAEEPEVVRDALAWQPVEGKAPLTLDVQGCLAAVLDR